MDTVYTETLKSYRRQVELETESDTGCSTFLREMRDRVAESELGEDGKKELSDLDLAVIEFMLDTGNHPNPELLQDHEQQPMEKWWWHLNALRAGIYT